MENHLIIAALNGEARRRGMTYGQLVGVTTEAQREQIVRKYRQAKEGRRKQRKKAAAP